MMRTGRYVVAMAGIVLASLALRLVDLTDRPVHTDEAVNATILGRMLEGEVYRYNPWDGHGPTLFFLAWPVLAAAGFARFASLEIAALRGITVAVGIGNILALSLLAPHFGRGAVIAAAALMGGGALF